MAPKRERRRTATTIIVAAFLVVGTGVAVTGTTGTTASPVDVAMQETTTTETDQKTNLSIRNLTAPERVRVGTNYTVSATIVNRGDEEVTNRFSYQIAGNVIASQFVELTGNETETIQFNVTENDTAGFPTGTFTHGVFTEGANATANLTLVGETTTTPAETTTTNETTTTATATETTTTTTNVTTATPTETTPAETTTPEEPATANITFERQTSNGSAVTVQSVNVPEGGFVVIHDTGVIEGEVIDSIIGVSSYLEPGTHRNVTVQFNESLNQSQRLVAIVYRDSNDNQEFDFVESNRRVDGPYTKIGSREAVNAIAVIEVQNGTTNSTA